MRFISTRALVGQSTYHQAFGTQRWSVQAFSPVSLVETSPGNSLQAIPFLERQIEHAHGMQSRAETSTSRAIGFYVTALTVSQTLRHHTVSRPQSRHHSRRNGVIRRLTPEYLPALPDVPITPQKGNQAKFGRFIAELIDLEGR